MYFLVYFLVFIILPFVLLFLFIKITIGPKTKSWLIVQSDRIKWYRLLIFLSLSALILFVLAFGLWAKYVSESKMNLDNSGMGLVVFIPPVTMALILLFASILAWYLNFKKDIRTNNVIFAVMGLLILPVSLLAICSLVWIILIIT